MTGKKVFLQYNGSVMDGIAIKEQVNLIREVFAYINRFKENLFVIKINYDIIDHSSLPAVMKDLAILHQNGIRLVLVAGARQRIDDVLDRYGIDRLMSGDTRISPPEAMPFIQMAAFDAANKVMTHLSGNNINAIIGNWVRARSIGVREGIDYQNTGSVDRIKLTLINRLLEERFIPIFPCIGWNEMGAPYNISSNELAARLAVELSADKAFFITGLRKITRERFTLPETIPFDETDVVSRMSVEEAENFLKVNDAADSSDPVLSLVSYGVEACRGGVKRSHIVDGTEDGVILKEIFSNLGSGTMIYTNEYEVLRPMNRDDIPPVLRIMKPFAEQNILVNRTASDLSRLQNDFVVYEVDGTIHGCGALHRYSGNTGEIAGIAVDKAFAHLGIGNRIVNYLIQKARKIGIQRIFLLTTRASDWFFRLGFKNADLSDLPEERKASYDKSRNSRIMVYEVV
jgi:amino-acid N-acetyltransferase